MEAQTASLIPSGEWKRSTGRGEYTRCRSDSFSNSLRGMETAYPGFPPIDLPQQTASLIPSGEWKQCQTRLDTVFAFPQTASLIPSGEWKHFIHEYLRLIDPPDSFSNSLRGMETNREYSYRFLRKAQTASLIPSGEWKRTLGPGIIRASRPDSFSNSLRGMETIPIYYPGPVFGGRQLL